MCVGVGMWAVLVCDWGLCLGGVVVFEWVFGVCEWVLCVGGVGVWVVLVC